MLTTIPFTGFYYSTHNDNIDREIESIQEELGDQNIDISDYIDFRLVWTKYAQGYTKCFVHELKDQLSLEFIGIEFDSIKFESLKSPREYNFETDRIFAEISDRDALIIYALVSKDQLKKYIAETFQPRSGFIPFYSDNVDDWDLLTKIKDGTADCNEIGTLLAVIINQLEINLDELMEDPIANGVVHNIVWDAINAEGKELLNAKVTP